MAEHRNESAASPGQPRALLALLHDAEQRAVEQVLHQEGLAVRACPTGQDLIEMAKQSAPDLLLVDVDWPVELPSLCRILARFHATRALLTVLVCPANIERHRLEKLQALGVFAILPRPLTYSRLATVCTQAVRHAGFLREQFGIAPPAEQTTTRHVESNSSLLIHQVRCPFHDEPTPVDRYVLRSGKIETEMSFFDIPIYKSATRGADYVDFNLLAVTVCPQCLFASNDPAHFIDPAEKSIKPVEWTPATRNAVAGRTAVRKSLAPGLESSFFTEARDAQQALVAYALAIDSAKTVYEHNKYAMPIELLRLANHHLRLMHLHEMLKSPVAKLEEHAREAGEWLKKAFPLLEGAGLYKTVYQLVAVALWTGEDKAAHQYMSRLAELERDATVPKEEKAHIERFHSRCKTAWEDRDLHRSPAYTKPAAAA
jgi:CheY-like chemotaxis protein